MRAHRRFALAMAAAAVLGVASAVVVVEGTHAADRGGTSTNGRVDNADPPPITTTSDPKPGEDN
ncbi:hypothetical protein FHS29_004799 [Saccharothrix tamanrassetensis]|uniref:Uncharacterized protein n=1 Tax=Saccharothrix tamanrassetensis TaxID=1051531 RepID=A0A841CKY7_9PSEU|nr:hypothetical protein [Saccharothrix tamanrassetensis]MBB5958191.1 hypothetical protein [Saccharothrix tamanrassetensis]